MARKSRVKTPKAITHLILRDAQPGEKYTCANYPGLQFEVSAKGIKSWYLRHVILGTSQRYKFGTFPETTLADAHRIYDTHRDLAAKGIDPRIELREERMEAEAIPFGEVAKWTLQNLAEAFVASRDESGAWKGARTGDDLLTRFRNHVYPYIHPNTLVVNIEHAQVRSLMVKLARHSVTQYDKIQKNFRAMLIFMAVLEPSLKGKLLSYAEGELNDTVKAITGIDPAKKEAAETEHEAALHWQDAPTFAQEINARTLSNRGSAQSVAPEAVLFTLLTAARTREVIGAKASAALIKRAAARGLPDPSTRPMRWRDVDLDKGVWTKPHEAVKKSREHKVPLSTQAIALLKRVKLKTGHTQPSDYVFYNPMLGKGGLYSNNALSSVIKRGPTYDVVMRNGKRQWREDRHPTTHGLRTTFSDFCQESGFDPHLVSAALDHLSDAHKKDSSLKNYTSTTLVELRRPMMQAWADYILDAKAANQKNKKRK